ncbi:hypothetical protein TNCT_529481 [Trichonephila clavata]|uniref:Uncharacterized protein n=1 Tax=Trichonephila clavata TaxID=2740835 RepID=A0A8X6LZ33_TRICU|nr:hypothetical protein TNCT_529481 [Trichonephila clavata]
MIDLEIAFKEMDFNKSIGMDGIHGQMFVNLSQMGRSFLLGICNTSWNDGKLPRDWKETHSIPIRKKNLTNQLMTPAVIDQSHQHLVQTHGEDCLA